MRHNALFRRFLTALTRGGPGGLPRPIEVHAHDPLRYVGDMLGWLHQARMFTAAASAACAACIQYCCLFALSYFPCNWCLLGLGIRKRTCVSAS